MPFTEDRGVVWVIDDSFTDAERVSNTLRKYFDVKSFQDGAVALEQLATVKLPDLLLLDWVMPGMTGLEICSYVRSVPGPISQIPIILLTAQHGSAEIAEAFKCGANDYIVKPFVEAELNARVTTLISSKQNLERAEKLVTELTQAKEEAERATRMKSAFLANMSHEIRTPLGAMLGFAHLMQDPSVTPMELANYIDVLVRNGQQLSVIINDILDLSKVEAGLLVFQTIEFNPSEVCKEVISLFKASIKEKDLTLEYIKDSTTPFVVNSDATRLRQILSNLINNAVKFTKVGGIKIISRGRTSADGTNHLIIDVQDSGIGVPEEHAERIFDRFVQGDESMTRKFGGTGIGLALSRELARELGGDLLLLENGKSGSGSTFRVCIANQLVTVSAESVPKLESSDSSKVFLDGLRILVVDDAPDNQSLLSLYLSKRGAKVEVAENGLEGYQKALKYNYDLILMDLQMPHMDGYATTKKLRETGYDKPIIALTAHAMSEVSAKCKEAGCNGFLPKPINPNELIATIASHTRN